LPATAFVLFLQNHDQIGNRALGERLAAIADPRRLRVGVALLLLSPQIPLVFMGEERGAREPFLYFASYEGELAEAVKNGRRKEFGKFPEFSNAEAQRRIPDPNRAETFEASRVDFETDDEWSREWRDFYRHLIALRRDVVTPGLEGARAIGAEAVGRRALWARWQLGNGTRLLLAANFGTEAIELPSFPGRRIFACGTVDGPRLAGASFVALLDD
jgi:maltooligosyltrehalose trehalohydrolase